MSGGAQTAMTNPRGLRHRPLSLERHVARVGFIEGPGTGMARMDRSRDGAGRQAIADAVTVLMPAAVSAGSSATRS